MPYRQAPGESFSTILRSIQRRRPSDKLPSDTQGAQSRECRDISHAHCPRAREGNVDEPSSALSTGSPALSAAARDRGLHSTYRGPKQPFRSTEFRACNRCCGRDVDREEIAAWVFLRNPTETLPPRSTTCRPRLRAPRKMP